MRKLLPGCLIALVAIALLAPVGPREATASPCKADGDVCRTSRSCCGTRGNDGVCVKAPAQGFGLCCTRVGSDTTCDGRDDDCDGLVDEGYVATPTTCGTGGCASTGSLVCENGALRDTCDASAADGQACTDGSVCTSGDTCNAGACTGASVPGCCETDQDCTSPNTCGGDGTPNVCGCTPGTCLPSDCGSVPDGCGGILDCPCSRCRGYCDGGLDTISTVCGVDQEQLCLADGCFDLCEAECMEHFGLGCDSADCIPCEP